MDLKTQARPAIPEHDLTAEERTSLTVDGMIPTRVLRPASPEDVARGLQQYAEAAAAVIVHGGGTQIGLGSPPRRYDVALSTGRLSRILEHQPQDLTCRAEAGVTLQALQDTLRQQGQRLPFDPPHPDAATLGGIVAANTNGLSRARHGTVRDWVIGIAVAYPNGKVARAGGKVVKNVAGYDLMKLHIGALGTLGVVVELNFKVQTVPEAEGTVLARFEREGDAFAAGHQLARRYLLPAALVLFNRPGLRPTRLPGEWPWALAARVEGYRLEIEAARAEVAAAVRDHGGRLEAQEAPAGFWESARDWPSPTDDGVVIKGVTSLASLQALVEAVPPDDMVAAQPASGIVHIRPQAGAPALLERLRKVTPDAQVIVERAPAALKASLDVWGPPPAGFALMQGLKRALDPKATLNPGRFVGGI